MATVSTTSILGSDSISASRITINSNFLILENWINGYVSTFGIDTVNGILDLSNATTGSIYAKTGYFDQIQVPSTTGSFLARILSTGAASFQDIQTTTFTSSGLTTISGSLAQNGISAFGATASFNGGVNLNGSVVLGPNGNFTSTNTTYANGLTGGQAFPNSATGGGGGYLTSIDSPYQILGTEDVIYANCGPTGFYLSVVGGSGGTAASISAGFRIRIINTSGATGYIYTGVQGSSTTYYTGFNTNTAYGNYATGGITIPQNSQYQSSVHLQWEPRVAQDQTTQRGSWIVLSGTNVTI